MRGDGEGAGGRDGVVQAGRAGVWRLLLWVSGWAPCRCAASPIPTRAATAAARWVAAVVAQRLAAAAAPAGGYQRGWGTRRLPPHFAPRAHREGGDRFRAPPLQLGGQVRVREGTPYAPTTARGGCMHLQYRMGGPSTPLPHGRGRAVRAARAARLAPGGGSAAAAGASQLYLCRRARVCRADCGDARQRGGHAPPPHPPEAKGGNASSEP
ncbi:hypothetical protein I4F81_010194 [Pyropia yezoensis]|uniref:Uncharacterized protein n=1 Tax=Pyropia yezoensis TaxID=2788 RepID=A0ACC3CBY6_PYRYE|nr:hypothetical protein I4F81_010194 [Neopyropia yezoensis]